MPLPILPTSSDTLIRLFHKTERHWTEHLGEGEQLSCGNAFCNPTLNKVFDANRLLDASLPEGMTPQQAFQEVEAHFAKHSTRCRRWGMNPSAAQGATAPFASHLESLGYERRTQDMMYLQHLPASPVAEVAGLKIFPARASYKHSRSLAEEWVASRGEPQLVEATMAHLDDPHWDALIALRDGKAVAMAGVLTVGEIGRIEQLFVSQALRRQGIGRTMMSRALEICARSVFRHVFLSCDADNAPAISLYTQLGFQKIGEIVSHYAPS